MTAKPFTWVELSRSALLHNAAVFRRQLGLTTFMAVVKGNAYGHGLHEISRILEKNVDCFGTANFTEALELRKTVKHRQIVVLSYWNINDAQKAAQHNITLVLHSLAQLKQIRRLPAALQQKLNLHMKLDVGTSRIGFLPVELPKLIYHLQKQPSLNIQGIFSHFAESEKADQSFTNKQNSLFCALVEKLEQQLGKIPLKHISCTAATLFNPASRHNMARIGIGLYGLWPTASNKRQYIELHPVLQWKTRVIAVKTLTAGATIGYERTYKVKRKMQIAVLPVGYADGLTRSLSSRGQVLLHGRKCTILGRISMNLCMIACNGMAVKSGDEVVLIGKQGREVQSAEDLAREMGTIHYEVVSHISPLLPRRVVK